MQESSKFSGEYICNTGRIIKILKYYPKTKLYEAQDPNGNILLFDENGIHVTNINEKITKGRREEERQWPPEPEEYSK